MKIKAKRLSDTAKLPTYGSEKAACADIYCDLRVDKCIELNASDINITSEQHLAMRINRDIFIFNDYEHHLSVYDVQDISVYDFYTNI